MTSPFQIVFSNYNYVIISVIIFLSLLFKRENKIKLEEDLSEYGDFLKDINVAFEQVCRWDFLHECGHVIDYLRFLRIFEFSNTCNNTAKRISFYNKLREDICRFCQIPRSRDELKIAFQKLELFKKDFFEQVNLPNLYIPLSELFFSDLDRALDKLFIERYDLELTNDKVYCQTFEKGKPWFLS